MALRDKLKNISRHIKDYQPLLQHNYELFDMYEGNLIEYLEIALRKQLSPASFAQIQHRLAPINILRRIIDKLSKIYQPGPVRRIVDGNDQDFELLSWYEEHFRANQKWNIGNEFFNMFKNTLVEPYITDDGMPRMRAIPSDKFLPYSDNRVDPTEPTVMIVSGGKAMKADGSECQIYRVYSDDEFFIIDENGDIVSSEMQRLENFDGVNPAQRIPFTYVNRSFSLLIPKPDSDIKKLSILIPVLLSDLNFVSMFQAFSMIWTIDIDAERMAMAPNAWLDLKSDGDGEKKPQIGTIKPEADIDSLLQVIQTQLAFWLNSRGIRPGAIAKLDGESNVSGISKAIDEMDTSEERQKQVQFFEDAECDFWNLVMHHLHPLWVRNGLIEQRALFSPNAKVEVVFAEQIPMMRRSDIITTLRDEIAAGFTTRKYAIKKLNPRMSDEEIEMLLAEIDNERGIVADEEPDQNVG